MQIIEDRRALHQIPELDKELPRTLSYLRESLENLDCRVFAPTPGSLCAWFDFGMPRAIAFRSDADALPIQERTGAPYASTHPGKMHACGHDGHMAILLELARRLSEKRSLPHNVLLIFQSAEETTGGAKEICDTGIFESYGVEAVFGLHLWPGLPAGRIFSKAADMMSSSNEVTVDITGKSAHIAKASQGLDALSAAVTFYTRAMALVEGETRKGGEVCLLKFGKLESGTVRNALAASAHMEGSIRTFTEALLDILKKGLLQIGEELREETGCQVEVFISDGNPPVQNPLQLFRRVSDRIHFSLLEEPSMTAEDFAWYQKNLPGMFFFLGLGDVPPLHADTFDFDEQILLKGADFFEELVEKFV